MKRLYVLIFPFFLIFGATQAQIDHQESMMREIIKGFIDPNSTDNPNIEGSPFLYEDFKPATLYFPEMEPITAPVRYNIAEEKMLVKFSEEEYGFLHPDVEVKLSGNLYKMYAYINDDNQRLIGYFTVLTDNPEDKKLLFLKKQTIVIEPGQPAEAMQEATPPSYEEETAHFIKFANETTAKLVERRTNDFLDLFPKAQRDKVKDYMKEENLKPRREEDVAVVVDYYNENF